MAALIGLVAVLAFFVGVIVFFSGLIGRTVRAQEPFCAGCRFSLAGMAQDVPGCCPECGRRFWLKPTPRKSIAVRWGLRERGPRRIAFGAVAVLLALTPLAASMSGISIASGLSTPTLVGISLGDGVALVSPTEAAFELEGRVFAGSFTGEPFEAYARELVDGARHGSTGGTNAWAFASLVHSGLIGEELGAELLEPEIKTYVAELADSEGDPRSSSVNRPLDDIAGAFIAPYRRADPERWRGLFERPGIELHWAWGGPFRPGQEVQVVASWDGRAPGWQDQVEYRIGALLPVSGALPAGGARSDSFYFTRDGSDRRRVVATFEMPHEPTSGTAQVGSIIEPYLGFGRGNIGVRPLILEQMTGAMLDAEGGWVGELAFEVVESDATGTIPPGDRAWLESALRVTEELRVRSGADEAVIVDGAFELTDLGPDGRATIQIGVRAGGIEQALGTAELIGVGNDEYQSVMTPAGARSVAPVERDGGMGCECNGRGTIESGFAGELSTGVLAALVESDGQAEIVFTVLSLDTGTRPGTPSIRHEFVAERLVAPGFRVELPQPRVGPAIAGPE